MQHQAKIEHGYATVDGKPYRVITDMEVMRLASDATAYQLAAPLQADFIPGAMRVKYPNGVLREEVPMRKFEQTYDGLPGTLCDCTLKANDHLHIATEKMYLPTPNGFRTVLEGDAIVFRSRGKRSVGIEIDILPQSAWRELYSGPAQKADATIVREKDTTPQR